MKIFLDMDGVLADFDTYILDKYGIKNCKDAYSTDWNDKTDDQKKLGNAIAKAINSRHFFRDLPVMPGAHNLWKAAHRGSDKPYVLTAIPESCNENEVKKDKRDWIHQYMNEVHDDEFIACERSEKVQYAMGFTGLPRNMTRVPNILIDDLPLNCKAWTKAGGYGILFEDSEQSIAALNEAHQYYGEHIDVE